MRHDVAVSDNPYDPPESSQPPQQPVAPPPPAAPPYVASPESYPAQPYPTQSYPTVSDPAQPYPEQPYPAQPPAFTQTPQTDGTAITALVLSICAWFVLPVVLAIVALVIASSASKTIAASNGARTGEGMVKAAKIIAWLNLLLFGLAIVFVVAFLIGLAVGG